MRIWGRIIACASAAAFLVPCGGGLRAAGAQTGRSAGAADAVTSIASVNGVVVEGTVYDSVAQAPLGGALVQLVPESGGAAVSALSDSAGRFRVTAVQPGRYLAGFLHPVLEQLGIEAPIRRILVPRGATEVPAVALALPAPRQIATAHCGSGALADSTGVVLGLLRDAATGSPLENGTITARWTEILSAFRGSTYDTREVTTRSRATGGFVLCGVPAGQAVLAQAVHGSAASGVLELALTPTRLLVRDLYVSDTTIAIAAVPPAAPVAVDSGGRSSGEVTRGERATMLGGTATLRGTIHAPTGAPVEGAHVRLLSSGAEQVTDADGRYTLTGLPAGTQMVEVRVLGYVPQRWPVDLRAGQVTTQALTLSERVSALAPVRVTARELVDFERRRATKLGRYMTREQIMRRPPATTSALLTRMGLSVSFDGQLQPVAPARSVFRRVSSQPCVPLVLIDRVRVPLVADMPIDLFAPRPEEIEAVEFYDGFFAQMLSGLDFSEHFPLDCGLLAIWTKRSIPRSESAAK